MGSCASVHKVFGSPGGKGGGAPVGDVVVDLRRKVEGRAGFGAKSPDAGSKDEMFFESRAWLDSDCEDDFYSVNGDFTPSRGNTPNYQPRTPTATSTVFLPDYVCNRKSPEPSPTGRRKLADLLQEATQTTPDESTLPNGEPDSTNDGQHQTPQSVAAAGKPLSEPSSVCSTEQAAAAGVGDARSRKDKAWYAGRCCLPTFVHSLTLEDERKQKMIH